MFDKITERIYIHSAEHYTDRPNIGLIIGNDKTLIFDAGNSEKHVEKLKKELSEQGLPNPDYVLLSHWHWDHSFGAKFWNANVIAGTMTNEELKKVAYWKWDEISMENRIKTGEDIVFCTEMIKREYPDRSRIEVVPADIVFDDRMTLDLGGISCELIHAKGPHSEDSVICYVPSEKFIFLGDANCKDLYGKPWDFDIEHEEDFLENVAKIPYDEELVEDFLALLKNLDFNRCISGHSEIMTKEELFESLTIKKGDAFLEKEEIKFAAERIEYLEKVFDEVKNSFKNDPDFLGNEAMQKKVSLLTQYMESGQWLRDFELDENGELPQNLKRGVLSEDGLYNLICDIEQKKKSDPLKKLFDKNKILFAIIWIAVYVLGFGNADMLSESIGSPKLITVIFGALLSVILLFFIKTNRLFGYFGLCRPEKKPKDFLFYIPLLLVSTANVWSGISLDIKPLTAVLSVLSMCFVGFLEELIFRGMLFTGMAKDGIKSAIIISSLTFGIGHIVNLLMGAPFFETLLQLVYASAAGFCYTAIFYYGKSIVPCILSHALINSLSVFGAESTTTELIIISAVQTAINIGYGIYFIKKKEACA